MFKRFFGFVAAFMTLIGLFSQGKRESEHASSDTSDTATSSGRDYIDFTPSDTNPEDINQNFPSTNDDIEEIQG